MKIATYSGAFLLLFGIIAIGYQNPKSSDKQLNQTVSLNGLATVNTTDQTKAPSVDDIVATDVAANLTEQTNLPIASNVANTAVSLSAKSEIAQTDDTTISKPQIVQPTTTNRSVQYYVTKKGDTIDSIAKAYNVSSNTVRWANNLSSDAFTPGTKLKILPLDGIEYSFKSGDTPASIASKYKTDAARIVSYNDLELSKAKVGQNLFIPGGILPANERPGYIAPQVSIQNYGAPDPTAEIINTSMAGASAGNKYAYGNCTWYAYNRRAELGRPVGSYWGNANTWGYNAQAAGFRVDGTPEAGAVLVDNAGYYGHVAIVERVNSNGSIYVSEMNNYAYGGFGIVNSRTISAGQASAYQYIH